MVCFKKCTAKLTATTCNHKFGTKDFRIFVQRRPTFHGLGLRVGTRRLAHQHGDVVALRGFGEKTRNLRGDLI